MDSPHADRLRRPVAAIGLVLVTVAASLTVARPWHSLAILTDTATAQAELSSGSIFPGQRVAIAFDVLDRSSGNDADASSPFAFADDARTATSAAWDSAFSPDRYLEFDLNAPLPASLAVSAGTFTFRFSSTGAAGIACHWFEVRRISTGEVIATHGSAVVPVACVTGTTFAASATAIPVVATTDVANDLRIRLFGRDSSGGGMRVDRATVSGQTAHAPFELYPVMFRDAADTTPANIPWELAGQ
jgi:hypothetical protein